MTKNGNGSVALAEVIRNEVMRNVFVLQNPYAQMMPFAHSKSPDTNAKRKARKERARELTRRRMEEIAEQKKAQNPPLTKKCGV